MSDLLPIEIENLHVRYGRDPVVRDVSLSVRPGEVYALLGRNGAGKSSLIRCLLGMQRPAAGRIQLFGRDVWRERAKLMERTGFVPEDAEAPATMTADAILDFCGALTPRWDGAGAKARLDQLGVPRKTQFSRLSKGEKRQVLLAAALAHQPELLVLDDPTLGLDVVARKKLFEEIIAELSERGVTIFLTTHDLGGVEGIADRVGILAQGRVLLDESVEALKSRFRRIRHTVPITQPAALEKLGAVASREWGGGGETVVASYDDVALERFRSEAGVREIDVAPLSLEEIFIALTERHGKTSEEEHS